MTQIVPSQNGTALRASIAILLGSCLLLVSGAARAQQYGYSGSSSPGTPPPFAARIENIGQGGQLLLGVERVSGFYFESYKVSSPAGNVTHKDTELALLATARPVSPSSIPRVAADYFVAEGISIGGSVAYWSDSERSNPNDPAYGYTAHEFLFNPRVGYAYAIDETFALWSRLGVIYSRFSSGDAKNTNTDLTLDAMLGISPVEHVVFLVGPVLDLGLGGSRDPGAGGDSVDAKLTTFGLAAGMEAYLP